MTQARLRGRAMLLGLLLTAPAMAQQAKDVCGDRPDCTVKGTQVALKGHEVIELSFGTVSEEEALPDVPRCEQREWWLRRPDKSVVKLVEACSGVGGGEVDVEVAKNRFIHASSGGAGTRWGNESVLQLSPLKWVSEESRISDAVRPWSQRRPINYTTFEGRLVWVFENCDQEEITVESQLVPQVELPADFLTGGWKHTSLGRCSVNGSFVLLGKAQGKEDARIRAVLAQGGVLLVEVVDDTWTGPGEQWLADDHVELWQIGSDPSPCDPGGKQAGLVQWGIRIADGKVFPAYGNPTEPLAVEVAREGKVARLKIQLPKDSRGLTVVYSDSDAGKKQELMVATSPLKFGDAATLSHVWQVDPTKAICQMKENQLAPVSVELSPKPGKAVIESE